jgi:hypothetical protein
MKRKIKHFLADHNAKSSSRSQDTAFLELHAMTLSAPRLHSDSGDSDSDYESDLKPQGLYPLSSSPEPLPELGEVNLAPSRYTTDPLCCLALDDWIDFPVSQPVPQQDWYLPQSSLWPCHFNSGCSDDAEGSIDDFGLLMPPLLDPTCM